VGNANPRATLIVFAQRRIKNCTHQFAALLEQRAQSPEVDAKSKDATGGQEIRAVDEDPKALLRGDEHCCGPQNLPQRQTRTESWQAAPTPGPDLTDAG
jgi:hypothetical protein